MGVLTKVAALEAQQEAREELLGLTRVGFGGVSADAAA